MKERLEAFCKAVNEKWPETNATVDTGGEGMWLWDVHQFFPDEPDTENGNFGFWCLHKMEGLALDPVLCRISSNQFRVSVGDRPAAHGPTRALACFNALCAVLGVE